MAEPISISFLEVALYIAVMEEKLKIFWEDVKDNSPAFFKNFSKDATKIIELFILHLVSEGSICTAIIAPAKGGRIMLSSEGFLAEFNTRVTIKDNVALLVWNLYEDETMLAIRLFPNGNYDIYFKYFEESKEEDLEVSKTLSAEEIEKLPIGVKWVLEETLKTVNWQRLDPKRLNQ